MKKKILIVALRKSAPFNEAWSKNLFYLSKNLKAEVIATGFQGKIVKKYKNYLIFKDHPFVYPLFGAWTLFKAYFQKFDIIILASNPTSVVFKLLIYLIPSSKLILNFRGKRNISAVLKIKRIKCLVVEEEDVYKRLLNSNRDVFFLKPIVDLKKFKYSPRRKNRTPFTFIFASAPLPFHKYPDIFFSKGIFLLLDSFKKVRIPNKRLIIIWRSAFFKELKEYIKKNKLENSAYVVNKTVNMHNYYKNSDVGVLAPEGAIQHTSEYPLSILECLATGRPVIISKAFELSKYIKKYNCGLVCLPTKNNFSSALFLMYQNYTAFQKKTLLFRKNYLEKIHYNDILRWLKKNHE